MTRVLFSRAGIKVINRGAWTSNAPSFFINMHAPLGWDGSTAQPYPDLTSKRWTGIPPPQPTEAEKLGK
nr:hypothetical protein Q903MT_gene69 [Picea sitchensis]